MERYPYVNDDFDLFDDVFGIPMFGNEPLMRTDVRDMIRKISELPC